MDAVASGRAGNASLPCGNWCGETAGRSAQRGVIFDEDPTLDVDSHRNRFLAEGDEVYLKLREQMSVQSFAVLGFQPPESFIRPLMLCSIRGAHERSKSLAWAKKLFGRTRASFSEIRRSPIMAVQNHRQRFDQNLIDLSAVVVDSLTKKQEQGQFDTIFIDRGEKDGVKIGNRFFVVRRGDGRHELGDKARSALPWEQIGEALVVRTQGRSSTALVTRSAIEIRRGDKAVMERHY